MGGSSINISVDEAEGLRGLEVESERLLKSEKREGMYRWSMGVSFSTF